MLGEEEVRKCVCVCMLARLTDRQEIIRDREERERERERARDVCVGEFVGYSLSFSRPWNKKTVCF